jgi:uncharacterized protein (DUF983 family)
VPFRATSEPNETMPARRAVWRSIVAGFLLKCPNCRRGRLIRNYLKVVDRCPVCGEAFHYHRADDAPAYFTILIVGHIVLPLMLVSLEIAPNPQWVHYVIWPLAAIGLTLTLLPRIKGALVSLQWALRMHGFETEPLIAE